MPRRYLINANLLKDGARMILQLVFVDNRPSATTCASLHIQQTGQLTAPLRQYGAYMSVVLCSNTVEHSSDAAERSARCIDLLDLPRPEQ